MRLFPSTSQACGDSVVVAVASAAHAAGELQLHGLDPEACFAEVILAMPYWPSARYLELAAKYWRQTRNRLDSKQLAQEFEPLSVP